jgi:hypothetical protein
MVMMVNIQTAKGIRDMKHAVMLTFVCAVLGGWSSTAGAEPYWVAYEGNDFPENEGWTRITYYGEANRRIEDGVLVIDSLHDRHIEDLVEMRRWMDPDPGELFVAEWRLMVGAGSTGPDAGVFIARSFQPGSVILQFTPDRAWIGHDNRYFDVAPGVFHTYRFESEDMIAYNFFIDGQWVYEGHFLWPASNQSYINFGDEFNGWASISYWDYLRFGVIPEPASSMMYLSLLCLMIKINRTS